MNYNISNVIIKVTKITIRILIVIGFSINTVLAVESNGQVQSVKEVRISLEVMDRPLIEAFRQIESKTEFHFSFSKEMVDLNQPVSLSFKNATVETILLEISKNRNLRFRQVNENISVQIKDRGDRSEADVEVIDQAPVTGKITDEQGNSLPGASVLVQGTTRGTITDIDGKYSIQASENDVLVISFVGYETQEIPIAGRSVVDTQMEPDVAALEEIVVVGYGTQRKSDLTGAVSLIDTEELSKQASNDVTQMMQGRVAGVSVTSDGQPGATPTVRVRGVGTFGLGAEAEPLYVVDGFPLSGGIRDINPNDIESVQVLKDATAGAIYGNRAANGVVIITTKGGKRNQKFSVGVDAYFGVQTVPQRIPVLGREDYQTIMNEALTNAGQPLLPGNNPDTSAFIDDVDTDWQDEGYKNGYIQSYDINFSGGTQNTSYYMSLNYLDNVGTLVGSGPDYKRYSFRVNSETQLGRFKIGENAYVMRSDENPLFFTTTISIPGSRPSLVNDLVQAAPTIPLHDENRLGGYGGADVDLHQSITLNVPGLNNLIENSTLVNRLLANLYGEVELIEGLTYRINLQYDNTDILDELFVPQYDLGYFFPGPTAQLQVGRRGSSSQLIENTLNFSKVMGKNDLQVLVGQTFQDFDARNIRTFGSGFELPYIKTLGAAASISATDVIQNYAISSFLGRLNYTYDDRYLLTVNVRRDGSSRFSEDNRYDIFPSVGVAWKIHNDINLPNFISDLKLRGGIGELGNQNIGNYAFQRTINRAIPYQFGDTRVLGAAVTILKDPDLKWETRITRNVAIDAVMLDGKLEFTAEYYSNTSEDVLLDLPIPGANGSLAGLTTNAGSIKNSGMEFSARLRQQVGDLTLDIAPNFYTVKNEVLDLGVLANLQQGGARTVVGRSIGEHYGWVYDGIFQAGDNINTVGPGDPAFDPAGYAFQVLGTSPGDIRFKDLNDDGIITDADRDFLGQGLPTYYYGINLVAGYKGFDFTFFGSGSGGNLINSNIYRGLMGSDAFGFTNRHEDILDRWTSENTNTDIPRMIFQDPNINSRDSDRPGWLQKGDYFRINTISLGYSLPSSVISGLRMSSARIYVTVQNVHTFTKYKGYNPDFQAGTPVPGSPTFNNGILDPGFDYGTFPRPRTMMIGAQLKF